MSFIGRAEPQVEEILTILLNPELINLQVPLYNLIPLTEFQSLNEEVQKHKFDMVVYRKNQPKLIVEVNYKHKEKAAKKWSCIFEPMLKKYGHETLLIKDYECDFLFKPEDYSKHKLSWDDVIDVCNALKTSKLSL